VILAGPDEDGFGPDQIGALSDVSRETLTRVDGFLQRLTRASRDMNLIGPSENRRIWRRHVWDSLQLLDFLPGGPVRIADLGSGAGFPGLVLAIALAPREGTHVTLVDKSPKKADFLRGCAEDLGLPVSVLCQRLDDPPAERFPILTARALAPAVRLLGYANTWMRKDGFALFLKGSGASSELTAAGESWTFAAETHMSRSDPDGRILKVASIRRRVQL